MIESGNESDETFSQVQERVVDLLERDLLASELKICLFMSALETYRYDSVLRPFPPVGLRDDGSKDVQKLVSLKTCC